MEHGDDYARAVTARDAARTALLARRLTYRVVQTRLREAAIEEVADAVTYLEARSDALAPQIAVDMRRVAALTEEAERLRVHAIAAALEPLLTELGIAVRAMMVQLHTLSGDLRAAVALAEQAQRCADALPKTELRRRIAANEASEWLWAMEELTRLLCFLVGEPPLPEPTHTSGTAPATER